jgi:erythritol transport system ATP-binding protein
MLAAYAVSMRYPGTLALDSVDYEVQAGRVNVLIGENGAGKSTLMRILAGEEEPTSGRVNRDVPVAMIHQELSLLPNMSVADNIFLGRERTERGVIDWRAQEDETRRVMSRLGMDVDPRRLVGDLPLGQQQLVEIGKALAREARVLIMDEPTSALSAAETANLFRVIREVKASGVGIVYISHRMQELLEIGDRVTVLRDGRIVAEREVESADTRWLVERTTGRPQAAVDTAQKTMTCPTGITGIYGLLGAGRTEYLQKMFEDGGGIRGGIALLPEDRGAEGIVPDLSVEENITLASMRGLYLVPANEGLRASEAASDLGIRHAGLDRPITSLSGGNQQKALLARCLLAKPRTLLLDEPTRGVDVGARAEIYAIIRRLAEQGMTVIFASSESHEVLLLADRILVMSRGRITKELDAATATEHDLMEASAA